MSSVHSLLEWLQASPAGSHLLRAYDAEFLVQAIERTRAQIAGSFTQPPGEAETMYQRGIYGASAGARVVIGR